ncbi:MAG: LysR family transcriptional regulator [Hydrocarboniphaga sp.]|nr:LysR family transcriptional regulator [Hydrocarboniphaga sp.]
MVAKFIRLHPQVEVEARISDRNVELVEEGVDLAIRIGNLAHSGLIARRIGETKLALCGSPEYLASAGVPSHPRDLVNHRFVGFMTPGTTNRYKYRFMIDGEVASLSFGSSLTVDDGDALVAAALQSMGIIMVADYLVDDLVQSGKLVRILQEYAMPSMPISVVHAPSRHLAPAAKVLIDMLRNAGPSLGNATA